MPKRKYEIDEELLAEICRIIRMGNYMETACKIVGIPYHALMDCRQKGKKEIGIPMNQKVWKDTEEARAFAEMEAVKTIKRVAEKNWLAAAWFLERTNFDKWGKKDQLNLNTISPDLKK